MSVKITWAAWQINLAHPEKLVLLALADNANEQGLCWPSAVTIAERCGMHERTVRTMIERLAQAGHVAIHARQGRSSYYVVTPGGAPGVGNSPDGTGNLSSTSSELQAQSTASDAPRANNPGYPGSSATPGPRPAPPGGRPGHPGSTTRTPRADDPTESVRESSRNLPNLSQSARASGAPADGEDVEDPNPRAATPTAVSVPSQGRSTEAASERTAGSGPKRQAERVATRLPVNFALSAERRAIGVAENLDAERTFAKFCDHWRAKAGSNARKFDWDATWRNWCRTEADRVNGVGPKAAPADKAAQAQRESLRKLVERRAAIGIGDFREPLPGESADEYRQAQDHAWNAKQRESRPAPRFAEGGSHAGPRS